MSELGKLRAEIDRIDQKIVSHLEKRFSLALRTLNYKKAVRDVGRERKLLRDLRVKIKNPQFEPFVSKIYGEIMKQSVKSQRMYVDKIKKRKRKR